MATGNDDNDVDGDGETGDDNDADDDGDADDNGEGEGAAPSHNVRRKARGACVAGAGFL